MKDATQIVIVLDRSGSMEVVREATIESFNQFMIKQKTAPGEASVYFVQFNTEYQVLFDKPIADALRSVTSPTSPTVEPPCMTPWDTPSTPSASASAPCPSPNVPARSSSSS